MTKKYPVLDTLTREILFDLYWTQERSKVEIAAIFNLPSYAYITKLFHKFDIPVRTPKEESIVANKSVYSLMSKEELETKLLTQSASSIAKDVGVNLTTILTLMRHYNIETTASKNKKIKSKIDPSKSLFEISREHNIDIKQVKYFLKDKPIERADIYSIEEIKSKIKSYDISNNGFIKQVKFGDETLYNSIIHHTKDHDLYDDKFTEKVYRIVNDITDTVSCRNCDTKLKFYTYEQGYGWSFRNLCESCSGSLDVGFKNYSDISQELFWKIYDRLSTEDKNNCTFKKYNYEPVVKISNSDREFMGNHPKLNSYKYYLDFALGNKNIEFDGSYFHDPEKDEIRDKFLETKGYSVLRINHEEYLNNKEDTLLKCMKFLNSSSPMRQDTQSPLRKAKSSIEVLGS